MRTCPLVGGNIFTRHRFSSILAATRDNLSLGFPTRSDTNRPVQIQKRARRLKGSRKKVYVSRLNFERIWRLLCYLYRISVEFSVKYNI